MDTIYTQTGSYIAIASIIVLITNHFFPGLGITSDQVVQYIADITALYGAIHQYFSHKNLAVATGAYFLKK